MCDGIRASREISDFLRQEFARKARSPGDWFGTGQMLMSAADVVKGNVAVQLMLSGFAFENLIKAIMVTRNIEPLKNGTLVQEYKGAHDLIKLAGKIGPVSDDEKTMLKWLSVFARWGGRYPISTTGDELAESFWKIEWQETAVTWWEHQVDRIFETGWIVMQDGSHRGPPLPLWRRTEVARFPLVEIGPRRNNPK